MKRSKWMIFILIGPALLSFILVYLYPTIRTICMSFFYLKNINDKVADWTFVGFDNYIRLLNSPMFKTSLMNIGTIWLYGGIIVIVMAMVFAVILTSGIRYKSFFRAVIYLPNIISAIAMATVWVQYVFNSQYGFFKTFFGFFHLYSIANFEWTSSEHIMLSLILAFSFGMVGYFMLMFVAGIEKIPQDFYEAATIEGANIFHQYFKITLPLLRDVFKTGLTWWSISSLTFFVWTQMFSPFALQPETVTPVSYMYSAMFGSSAMITDPKLINAGAGAAVGVILSILAVVVFIIVGLLIKNEELEY